MLEKEAPTPCWGWGPGAAASGERHLHRVVVTDGLGQLVAQSVRSLEVERSGRVGDNSVLQQRSGDHDSAGAEGAAASTRPAPGSLASRS